MKGFDPKVYDEVSNKGSVLARVSSRVRRMVAAERFEGSASYWEHRYESGGDSGAGSYGRLAAFKASVLNDLVAKRGIESVIELGCGDGAQLELANYPQYTGVDVAKTSVERCSKRFHKDDSKRFVLLDEASRLNPHDMGLSLDVVYHLVEDEVFEAHMKLLFELSRRYVVVYSSNEDSAHPTAHVRHRKFSDWISLQQPDWKLVETIVNPYGVRPGQEDDNGSFADFYIYERV